MMSCEASFVHIVPAKLDQAGTGEINDVKCT